MDQRIQQSLKAKRCNQSVDLSDVRNKPDYKHYLQELQTKLQQEKESKEKLLETEENLMHDLTDVLTKLMDKSDEIKRLQKLIRYLVFIL